MILVTGATGFLGSELVKQLTEKGETVRATKRASSVIPALLSSSTSIEWVNADILDYYALEDAFNDVTEVYHCAAYISFDPKNKQAMCKINVEGTANLVNICLSKSAIKLVHVSSIAAVGESKDGRLITENDQWVFDGIHNDYAISKYQGEMEVWRGIAEGLNAVIVNPSIIIGKNAGTEGSGKLFETVRKGLRFYTSGSCGLADVEDVAKNMIFLMKSDLHSERFIINAENRAFQDLFTEIALNFKISPPAFLVKPWMLGIAWRMSGLASIFTGKQSMTRYMAHSAAVKQEYTNDKIKNATGIEFKPVSETIAEICTALTTNYKTN